MSHAERTHRNMQCIPTKRWQLPVENEQSSNPHPRIVQHSFLYIAKILLESSKLETSQSMSFRRSVEGGEGTADPISLA